MSIVDLNPVNLRTLRIFCACLFALGVSMGGCIGWGLNEMVRGLPAPVTTTTVLP